MHSPFRKNIRHRGGNVRPGDGNGRDKRGGRVRRNQLALVCLVMFLVGLAFLAASLTTNSILTIASTVLVHIVRQISQFLHEQFYGIDSFPVIDLIETITPLSATSNFTTDSLITGSSILVDSMTNVIPPNESGSLSNMFIDISAGVKADTPKLLYMTASNTMGQLDYLIQSLESVKDICNTGWVVSIHLQVSNGLTYDHPTFKSIQDKLYCQFMRKNVPIVLEVYPDIGFGLNSRHRLVMQSYINEYDYFVYAEEDMILTPKLLSSYLEASLKLKTYLPKTWLRYYIGFLRYEWQEEASRRVTWEYYRHQVRNSLCIEFIL